MAFISSALRFFSGLNLPLKGRVPPDRRPALTPPVRALIRYLPSGTVRRLLWKRLVARHLTQQDKNFVARSIFGMRFAGNTGDHIQRQLYYFGAWEPALTSRIVDCLSPGDTFVDVGANIGYFSLLGSRLVGSDGEVLAIEASPSHARALLENVELNRVSNVTVFNVVASDSRHETQVFRGAAGNSGTASVISAAGKEVEAVVDAMPLADIIAGRDLDRLRLIKIDVEGAEWLVIAGLASVLSALPDPCEMIVEIHAPELAAQGKTVEDVIGPLRDAGFKPSILELDFGAAAHFGRPDNALLQPFDKTESPYYDLLFGRAD